MTSSTINLNSYREEVVELFQNNVSTEEIASHLSRNYNIQITFKTVKRRLTLWGVKKQIWNDDSSQLQARISALFFECCAEDKEILYILKKEGYQISKWSLKNLQQKLELRQQVSHFNWEEADQKLHETIQEELDKDFIEEYRCGFLYYHFCNEMHMVFR